MKTQEIILIVVAIAALWFFGGSLASIVATPDYAQTGFTPASFFGTYDQLVGFGTPITCGSSYPTYKDTSGSAYLGATMVGTYQGYGTAPLVQAQASCDAALKLVYGSQPGSAGGPASDIQCTPVIGGTSADLVRTQTNTATRIMCSAATPDTQATNCKAGAYASGSLDYQWCVDNNAFASSSPTSIPTQQPTNAPASQATSASSAVFDFVGALASFFNGIGVAILKLLGVN